MVLKRQVGEKFKRQWHHVNWKRKVQKARCRVQLVVLASGQVCHQSYLSFASGQVNLQKINKTKCLKCSSREISIKLSFRKCKTDCFSQKKLTGQKLVEHLRFICHFISIRSERGLGLIWGYQFVHLLTKVAPQSYYEHRPYRKQNLVNFP